ncbi:MAG: YcaO-like family protein [Bdellovibrionaceae bacterium]|nr:YcaO-like family protein [Pseudobdellovibrionaceae bacterium]
MIFHLELDNPLLRFVGPRLSPVKNLWAEAPDHGFEPLWVVGCAVANPLALGGSVIWPPVSAGQSVHIERAIFAAIGEGLERLGATCRPANAAFLRGSHSELSEEHNLFPLDGMRLFSEEQTRDPSFNLKNIGSSDRIEWIRGTQWKAQGEEKVYYPFPRVSLNQSVAYPYDITTTNGLAVGPNWEWAFEKALAEVIERDAFLTAWWLKRPAPVYGYEDLRDLDLGPVSDAVEWLGDRLWILDFTERWNIPAFISVFWGRDGEDEPPVILSGGCGPDAKRALQKAIEEGTRVFIGQMKNRSQKTSRRILPPYDETVLNFDDGMRLYFSRENRSCAEFLLQGPRPGGKVLREVFAEYPSKSEVGPWTFLKDRVLRKGARILAFDLTPIDMHLAGLKLARIVVPEAVPLNAAHRARPWGCLGLRRFDMKNLNPMPHPYP